MPETVFQESAAKVAIGFYSEIRIFENAAFGHVTEAPNSFIKSLDWIEIPSEDIILAACFCFPRILFR